MTCLCEMCSSSPAPTYTRAYLLACLARELSGWMPEERREFLVKFAEGKGEAFKAEFRKALKECGLLRGIASETDTSADLAGQQTGVTRSA